MNINTTITCKNNFTTGSGTLLTVNPYIKKVRFYSINEV